MSAAGDVFKELEAAFESVTGRMADAAERSGRRTIDVELVAVTKYATAEQLRHLVEMGHRDLGESRVQQLTTRAAELAAIGYAPERPRAAGERAGGALLAGVRWHMIGHLQRNKAQEAADVAWLTHSLDSERLADRLNEIACALSGSDGAEPVMPIPVLLQVNVSGEASKYGVPAEQAEAMARHITGQPGLVLRGLMTMAPHSDDPEHARPTFARCRQLFETLRAGPVGRACEHFDTLSMGMSGDFEVAIEEGATVVRVGSALFGGQFRGQA